MVVRDLPLIKRLEDALAVASSETEINSVYIKLNNYVCSHLKDSNEQQHFYRRLNHQTLLPEKMDSNNDKERLENGKTLADYLRASIIMPDNLSNFQHKMKRLRQIEFQKLKEYQNGAGNEILRD